MVLLIAGAKTFCYNVFARYIAKLWLCNQGPFLTGLDFFFCLTVAFFSHNTSFSCQVIIRIVIIRISVNLLLEVFTRAFPTHGIIPLRIQLSIVCLNDCICLCHTNTQNPADFYCINKCFLSAYHKSPPRKTTIIDTDLRLLLIFSLHIRIFNSCLIIIYLLSHVNSIFQKYVFAIRFDMCYSIHIIINHLILVRILTIYAKHESNKQL